VVPPEQQRASLRAVSFRLEPGQALGVIGPSASGKSTLARTLAGIWRPVAGAVRLDSAELDHYGDDLGRYVGYLPQDIALFDGTVAENIARFRPEADPEAVIAAATAAGFHDQVLALPDGYNTPIGMGGAQLSAGQKQRLGLARALYGAPFLVVLDEPNSNLDVEGEAAVGAAIAGLKARGAITVVIAHRPSAIAAVDLILVMKGGEAVAFGPKDEVLARTVQNARQILDRQAQRADGRALQGAD
jgi:ATP-binding cassette subfamily C protein